MIYVIHVSLLTILIAQADSGGGTSPVSAGVDWWGALAGLHPLVLHFPIALVLVAAAVEFVALLGRRERLTSFSMTAIIVGAPFTVLAAWSGWAMADNGYGSGWQLSLHRWLGVSSAILLVVIFLLTLISWFGSKAWATATTRGLLLIAAILIGITAHFGGDMVWGESLLLDSLFPQQKDAVVAPSDDEKAAPAEEPASSSVPAETPATPATAPVAVPAAKVSFTYEVVPILKSHCWDCHAATGRAKAGIRLASQADFRRVIDGHAMVTPGSPEKSLLYTVVTAPRDDDLAMPPDGPGLSSSERATLDAWISQGAIIDSTADGPSQPPKTVVTTPSVPASSSDASALSDTSDSSVTPSPAVLAASDALNRRGISVRPIARTSPLLVLNASGLSHRIDPPFGDSDMKLVAQLSSVLAEINISSTQVTDEGVQSLSGFAQLKQVSLKETRTSDPAARVLSSLPVIESVNFFGTELGDQGLLELASAPTLKRIYAGQTRVTESGVAAVKAKRPDLSVIWQATALPGGSEKPVSTEK